MRSTWTLRFFSIFIVFVGLVSSASPAFSNPVNTTNSQSFIGRVQLDPAARAVTYKVKIKQSGESRQVSRTLFKQAGEYRVKAELFYDLDRLNDFNDASLPLIASTEIEVKLKSFTDVFLVP